jgi:hypothetical protein
MPTTRPTTLGALVLLILLCLPRLAGAVTILLFESTETGTYLFTLTSATMSHAVAAGSGSGSFGTFQSSGSQDSDFTDPLLWLGSGEAHAAQVRNRAHPLLT